MDVAEEEEDLLFVPELKVDGGSEVVTSADRCGALAALDALQSLATVSSNLGCETPTNRCPARCTPPKCPPN